MAWFINRRLLGKGSLVSEKTWELWGETETEFSLSNTCYMGRVANFTWSVLFRSGVQYKFKFRNIYQFLFHSWQNCMRCTFNVAYRLVTAVWCCFISQRLVLILFFFSIVFLVSAVFFSYFISYFFFSSNSYRLLLYSPEITVRLCIFAIRLSLRTIFFRFGLFFPPFIFQVFCYTRRLLSYMHCFIMYGQSYF